MQEKLSKTACCKEMTIFQLAHEIIDTKQLDLVLNLDSMVQSASPVNISQTELLLLYYIFYVLLNDRDRDICFNIKHLLTDNNNTVFKKYDHKLLEKLLNNKNNDIIDLTVMKMSLLLMKNYMPSFKGCEEVKESLDELKSNIIALINEIFFFNFSHIQDDILMMLFISFSVFDYKAFLSPFEYDKLSAGLYKLVMSIQEYPDISDELFNEDDEFNSEQIHYL